jgi:branched-chain amino acid transport system ATP-binding protein
VNQALLAVKNLRVSYGAIEAVKGISFEVYAGEIVALIGANGAGKTTTLRAISGLVDCVGNIDFESRSIHSFAAHDLVTQGLVQSPEGRGIFLNLTVEENLLLGAYRRKDRSAVQVEMDECFHMFPRLKERLHSAAGTLSGGEQQMLSICRALLSKPKLLILDEPSLGLAPKVVQQIFSIVKSLNESKGMTVLLVEQNARMALRLCHRAYVLETGHISISGLGKELLNDARIQQAYLGGG